MRQHPGAANGGRPDDGDGANNPDRPNPEYVAELTRGLAYVAKSMATIHTVSATAKADKVAFYRLMLGITSSVAHHMTDIIRSLAVNGVIEGAISRRLAGEMLGVHQATIARWVKEADGQLLIIPTPSDSADQRAENATIYQQWLSDDEVDNPDEMQ